MGTEVGVFDTEVEFLETRGDGHLLETVDDDEIDDAEEEEGEGDMYLEETCLDLGLLGPTPLLSLSEGNNGGLLGFRWASSRELILGFCGSIEAAPEIAATIITKN